MTVVAIVAGAALLGGCAQGRDSDAAVPGATVSTAAPSEDAAVPVALTAADFMDRVVATQTRHHTVRVAITSDAGLDLSAQTTLGELGPFRMSATGTFDGRKMDLRVDGDTLYATSPDFDGMWLKGDLSDPADTLGAGVGDALHVDPTRQLEDLRGAVTDVVHVGPEAIEGEPVEHYVVTVDPAKVTGDTAASLAPLQDITEIDYDYWIDGRDRARRVSFELVGHTTRVDLTGWDEQLVLELPAPEMVASPEDLGLAG
ncbi:hypothetical protein ACQFYA_12275 [Promicromonospora sp. Marseille-Q5078]